MSAVLPLFLERNATFQPKLLFKAYPYPTTKDYRGRILKAGTTDLADPADALPLDFTGCSASFLAYYKPGDRGQPLLSLSTDNSGIVLGGATGSVALLLAADKTTPAVLSWESAVYYLTVTYPDGTAKRYATGPLTVI